MIFSTDIKRKASFLKRKIYFFISSFLKNFLSKRKAHGCGQLKRHNCLPTSI
ncbi:hypothetical protein QY97_01371 [Bacillus thermotolerans]|nr:hypothetical protein QY97_01371 [Bacillus thermotolerans]